MLRNGRDSVRLPVPRPSEPRRLAARYPGRCACGAAVAVGAEIGYADRKIVDCPTCRAGAPAGEAAAPAPIVDLEAVVAETLASLTAEQRIVAEKWREGYARLIATAGSGKTRTVAALVGRLLRDGVTPASILVTSFTVKAASELRDRLSGSFGPRGAAVTCGTMHSLVRRWLVEHYESVGDRGTARRIQNPLDGGGKPDLSRYDADAVATVPRNLTLLAQQVLGGGSLRPYLPGDVGLGIDQDPAPTLAEDYLSAAGYLRAYLIGPDEADRVLSIFPEKDLPGVAPFYALLDRACRALGVSTFDEWLFLAARLAEDGSTGFAHRVGSRLGYTIIDEAQDNNLCQLVIGDRIAAAGSGRLLLVGDVRQSIYRFRGAVPDYVARLADYTGREVATYYLSRNFRSAGPIVDLGNRIAAGQSWDVGPPAIAASRWTDMSPSEALSLWSPGDAGEEAAEVGDLAREVLQAWDSTTAGRPIVVLARTNAALGPVEVALLRRKLPYAVTRGCGFFSRREIQAVVAYLRLAYSLGADEDAVRIAASTSSRRIGRYFAQVVAERMARGLAPAVAVRDAGRASPGWRSGAADLADAVDAVAGEPDLGSAVGRAVLIVRRHFESPRQGAPDNSRIENLAVLVQIVGGFQDAAELLGYAGMGARVGDAEEGRATVILSTVHGFKGLESQVVVVVGAIRGQFPHARAIGEEEQAEEARIEYVAATRAMHRLILSAPKLDPRGEPASPAALWGLAREILDGARALPIDRWPTGSSSRDGESLGSAFGPQRDRSSLQRGQARQPTGEPRVDEPGGSRSASHPSEWSSPARQTALAGGPSEDLSGVAGTPVASVDPAQDGPGPNGHAVGTGSGSQAEGGRVCPELDRDPTGCGSGSSREPSAGRPELERDRGGAPDLRGDAQAAEKGMGATAQAGRLVAGEPEERVILKTGRIEVVRRDRRPA